MPEKCCWTCKHFWQDRSVDAYDCMKADDMTEDQFEEHFVNDKPDCPFWEQQEEWM